MQEREASWSRVLKTVTSSTGISPGKHLVVTVSVTVALPGKQFLLTVTVAAVTVVRTFSVAHTVL